MSRYEQLADYLEGLVGDRAVLSFSEVERLIGSPLPASARKLRTWWSNDATHSQARRGWLSAGWRVIGVDMEAGAVEFMRRGGPSTPPARGEAGFSALAAEALGRIYGVRLYREVSMEVRLRGGGSLKRVFDLASPDGSIIGEVMYLRSGRTPAARFPAIAENVWLLEKADAAAKFIAFGGDSIVPKMWLSRFGALAGDVRFYFVREDGKVDTLR